MDDLNPKALEAANELLVKDRAILETELNTVLERVAAVPGDASRLEELAKQERRQEQDEWHEERRGMVEKEERLKDEMRRMAEEWGGIVKGLKAKNEKRERTLEVKSTSSLSSPNTRPIAH